MLKEKRELKKASGDVFFEAYYDTTNHYIFCSWIGIQSLETVMMGGGLLLSILQERPCAGLLNSNLELIGPWEVAVPYLTKKWGPKAKELGLQYFAHVLSPGIFGQRSYKVFREEAKGILRVKAFQDVETAEDWLLLHLG
ncbi:hypothetical protein [Rufibacter roseus]|uniref:STAS/SEC14 domain-containing protein n=1 Tax=Rufibacter roseus TaxID=1567108 RepID=A0ABW2DR41_9BACT|nr:hypothetical protein [Rufibacter roseus]